MYRELIELAGGVTYVLLIATVITGLARWKFGMAWAKPKFHFFLGTCAIIMATCHFLLIAAK